MKKKLISLLMAVLIIVTGIPFAFASNEATITISSATASPGEVVALDVEMANNPGINTFSLSFNYDTSRLSLQSVTVAEELGGQFAYSKKAVWLNSTDSTYNGKILTATFKVLDAAQSGNAEVSVSYSDGDISNYNEEDVAFKLVPGKISVEKEAVPNGTITVSSATAAPGEEVSLDVLVAGNPGINTFSLSFNYDTSRLSLQSVTVAEELGGQFAYSKKAVWINNSDVNYNGKILTAVFKVLDDAQDGDAAVAVSYSEGEIANFNEEDVNFDLVAGKVSVKNNDPNAPKIVIDSKRVTRGKEFDIAVRIENNPGFAYLELTPVYSPELTLVSVSNGSMISDFTQGKQYVWVADEDVHDDGVLLTYTFSVTDEISTGEYSVDFKVRMCANYEEQHIGFSTVAGTIEVIDYVYGDVNGDGNVDGFDVIRLKKYLANYDYETQTSTVDIQPGADANGDNEVNGFDVIRLKKYLANYDYETGTSSIVLGK